MQLPHVLLSWISSTRGRAGFRFTQFKCFSHIQTSQIASQTYDLQNFYALPAMTARSAYNKSDSLVLRLGADNLQTQRD